VLQFFDATLRDDREADAALTETHPWTPTTRCVVRVPRGVSSPAPYDVGSEIPPTPRQFVRMLATPGIEQACRAIERSRSSAPQSPICADVTLAGSMLYHLFDTGRDDDATRYYGMLTAMSMDVAHWFVDQAEDEEREVAKRFLNLAHRLKPEDRDIAARLRSG
jgi:hypothetical protein